VKYPRAFSANRITRNRVVNFAVVFCGIAFFGMGALAAYSQDSANTAKPIPIKTVKAKPAQFEGTVMHANSAQITVRGKENELAVRTFTLSPQAAEKIQHTIDRGGFQYGDRVKVEYDPVTSTALKIKKGKPAKSN
jgi:hypothetical protein